MNQYLPYGTIVKIKPSFSVSLQNLECKIVGVSNTGQAVIGVGYILESKELVTDYYPYNSVVVYEKYFDVVE